MVEVCAGLIVTSAVGVGVPDTTTFGAAASCFSCVFNTSRADFYQGVNMGSITSARFTLTWRDVENDRIIPKKSSTFMPSAVSVDSP